MNNNLWKKIIIALMVFAGIMIVLAIIPGFVALVTTPNIINVNTESQWISFWGNYLGALIGGTISGSITLFVMVKTLESGKKERRLLLCDNIVELCTEISNAAAIVTMKHQKFLGSAHENDKTEAILCKNRILDDIWKALIKLEAKQNSYAYTQELCKDLIKISSYINSFSINELDYTDEKQAENTVALLVNSKEYKKVENDCRLAANEIEKMAPVLGEHLKTFYYENTRHII